MSVNVYDPINDELIPVAGATLFAEMPLGAIQAFDSTDIPSSFLEFKGQTVNRADYPDLWAHIVKNSLFGEGKFYGIGDGATTFTLADLRETSLKGYGETSRSVGAHVKSGGLGIGEFIDDQVQNFTGEIGLVLAEGNKTGAFDVTSQNQRASGLVDSQSWTYGKQVDFDASRVVRAGTTTEVKAVGVVWAVKAKQTGLPIDLKQEISKAESYSTAEVRTNKTWIDGKPIYRKVIVGTAPSTVDTDGEYSILAPISSFVSVSGFLTHPTNAVSYPLGQRINENERSIYWGRTNNHWAPNRIVIKVGPTLVECPVEIIVEYTKTTD